MSFLYPFLNFLQPGILWPGLADFRPMLVLSAMALCLSLFVQGNQRRKAAYLHPSLLWLLVFVMVQVASVASNGISTMLNTLQFWMVYPIYVVVAISIISSITTLRRFVVGMSLGGGFVLLYGIYAVIEGVNLGATGRAGAYGMYENHNDYTFAVLLILPYFYMFSQDSNVNWFLRCLSFICACTCMIGIFLSLSRGGLLALLLQLALIVILMMHGRKRLVILPVLALAGALAAAYLWAHRAENQANYTAEDAQSSRFELWRAGWEMVKDKPLLGVGSRQFYEYSGKYYELSGDQRGKNSHNTFIEIVASSGLLGLASFLMMIWTLIASLRRACKSPLASAISPIRVATLVSLYTILARANLDEKTADWSFYTLIAIGIACSAICGVRPDRGANANSKTLLLGRNRTHDGHLD